MCTASHQLNNLSLDLMYAGALEDHRVVRQPVNAEGSQKRLRCGGKNIIKTYFYHL